MIRFFLVFLGVIFCNLSQVLATRNLGSDPVFMRIENQEIRFSEFEAAYKKNNNALLSNRTSPEEYLELFINFKLKVAEAQKLGLDTNPSFVEELAGYREQLAKPYFSDQEVIEKLVEEAYQRSLIDVRASHILLLVDAQATPADTLVAWQKANFIRQRIIDGEPFDQVARQESDDVSARDREVGDGRPPVPGNGGDLRYFTVFNMAYPFETVAYSLGVGEVSQPVRSDFGYHLIKVTDRLPAMGKARVAHVMAMFNENTNKDNETELLEKMQVVLEKHLEGEDFGKLAQEYSDDFSSKGNNGEMRPFGSREMVPEFIKTISQMEIGEVAGPIRTNYGYHLVKLLERNPPPPFDEAYNMLKNSVMQDSRSFLGEQAVVDRLKAEYNFSFSDKALHDFFAVVDSTIFNLQWDQSKAQGLDKLLFSYDGVEVYQADFAEFLAQNQAQRPESSIEAYVRNMFDELAKRELLKYENARLELNFPEFRAIMAEYHDGMLLFELTNQKVWNKAIKDSLGLAEFFEANRQNYQWPKRVNATTIAFDNNDEAQKAYDLISKTLNTVSEKDELVEAIEGVGLEVVSIKEDFFGQGQNQVIDSVLWQEGLSRPIQHEGKFYIVNIVEVMQPRLQELGEVRGYVINDYQNFLDKQWIAQLRDKYDITVNRELLQYISD